MAMLKIETDRGYGWQVRAEGEVPAGTSLDTIKDQTLRCALNGPSRAWLDGELVFECKKLTAKQGKALFGI